MSSNPDSVVLEEEIDQNYEPTQEEIIEYATWLGMDLDADKELFWVAREGLKAPLPPDWKPCKSPDGEIYYFNFKDGSSVWDHPCDDYYKNMYKEEKQKLAEKKIKDAERARKEKEDKAERKKKKKEAKAAKEAMAAQQAQAGSGLGMVSDQVQAMPGMQDQVQGLGAPMGGLGAIGGLGPIKSLNKSAPLAAPKSAAQRQQEEAAAAALQAKYDQMKEKMSNELASELATLEDKETAKKDGELKRALQSVEANLNEKKVREQATKTQLTQEVAQLKQRQEQEGAEAMQRHQTETKQRAERELAQQLEQVRDEHTRKVKSSIESIHAEMRSERETKARQELSKMRQANDEKTAMKRSMHAAELDRVKSEYSRKEGDAQQQEAQASTDADATATQRVEEQKVKNDADIEQKALEEKKRSLENLTMKLEMQQMRSDTALTQRESQQSAEHALATGEARGKLEAELQNVADKEVSALREELTDQKGAAAEAEVAKVKPQVDALLKELQETLDKELAEMQKAHDEKIETMLKSKLDGVRENHERNKTRAQKEYDEDLAAAREQMGTQAREQAERNEKVRATKEEDLYKKNKEAAKKEVDAASEKSLQEQLDSIKAEHDEAVAVKVRMAGSEADSEVDKVTRDHTAEVDRLMREAEAAKAEQEAAMKAELAAELAAGTATLTAEIKAAEETERARIMSEAAKSAGVSSAPPLAETASDKEAQRELESAEAEQAAAQARLEAAKASTKTLAEENAILETQVATRASEASASAASAASAASSSAAGKSAERLARVDGEMRELRAKHMAQMARHADEHEDTVSELRVKIEQRSREQHSRENLTQAVSVGSVSVAAPDAAVAHRRENEWTQWKDAQASRVDMQKMQAQSATRELLADVDRRLGQMRQRVLDTEARSTGFADSIDDGAAETLRRRAAMDARQRDSLRVVVQSLSDESARLRAELNAVASKRASIMAETAALQTPNVQQQETGWAGLIIGERGLPTGAGRVNQWPSDTSDSMTDSGDSASSWLVFPELSPLEQTDLSVSFGGGMDDLDQSSVYVNQSDVQRESKRLGMADEFVRGQAAELQTRKRTLAQLRATWKRDFKAASKRSGGNKENSRSKMALLESVRKMLDQQERNMSSEAKQLASVGEYLRLRQEKLNLVETSFTQPRGHGADMSYSAPDAGVMNRLEGLEHQIGRLVRMMHEPPPQQQQQQQQQQHQQQQHQRPTTWAEPVPSSTRGVPAFGTGTKWDKRHAHAATSDKRPVWDFQKVLGQWAEERDVTRELLNQHTNWIDHVQRDLMTK